MSLADETVWMLVDDWVICSTGYHVVGDDLVADAIIQGCRIAKEQGLHIIGVQMDANARAIMHAIAGPLPYVIGEGSQQALDDRYKRYLA